MFPPESRNDVDSEGDSDDEENPNMNFNKLSGKLLEARAEYHDRDEIEESLSSLPTTEDEGGLDDNGMAEIEIHERPETVHTLVNNNSLPPATRKSRVQSNTDDIDETLFPGPARVTRIPMRGRGRGRGRGQGRGSSSAQGHCDDHASSASDDDSETNLGPTTTRGRKRQRGSRQENQRARQSERLSVTIRNHADQMEIDTESDDDNHNNNPPQPRPRVNPEYNRVWSDEDQGVGSKVAQFEPNQNES